MAKKKQLEWQDYIAQFSAPQLNKALGIGLRTAYDWLEGKPPREWVQRLIRKEMG